MPSNFKYQRRDPALLEKRLQSSGFQGIIKDDYKTFRPVKGDNWIRILPPTWENPAHYALTVFAHYRIGPDNASVLCLSRMKRTSCPVCQAQVRATRAGDEDLAKELAANENALVWMVDMKDRDKGPQIWAMSRRQDTDIIKVCRDRESGSDYVIDDPEEGYNISFDRDGEGIQTRYSGYQVGRNATSVPQKWIDFVVDNPLPDCLVWRDYDEVKALYDGVLLVEDKGTESRDTRDEERRDTREREEPRRDTREREEPRSNGRDEDRRDDRRETRDRDEPRDRPRDEERRDTREREEPRGNGRDAREDEPRERPQRERMDREETRARDPEPERDRSDEQTSNRRGSASDDAPPSGRSSADTLREKFANRAR